MRTRPPTMVSDYGLGVVFLQRESDDCSLSGQRKALLRSLPRTCRSGPFWDNPEPELALDNAPESAYLSRNFVARGSGVFRQVRFISIASSS